MFRHCDDHVHAPFIYIRDRHFSVEHYMPRASQYYACWYADHYVVTEHMKDITACVLSIHYIIEEILYFSMNPQPHSHAKGQQNKAVCILYEIWWKYSCLSDGNIFTWESQIWLSHNNYVLPAKILIWSSCITWQIHSTVYAMCVSLYGYRCYIF